MSIISYKSIELTDILYYKKAKFVFKPGITVIRGLNKNGNVDKNPNGVGKSLLFSCIPNIIYATTPLAKKNDKKSLFASDKAEIRFTFKKEGHVWTIVQKAKKKTIDYEILKDGEDQKPRTVPIAEAKIKELFGISEELFYTKDYISIQRPHLFLRGTSTQRQEFFTEVFKLDHYDKLRASFLLQVRELKSKKVKADLLKEQLQETTNRLEEIAWTTKKEQQINTLEVRLNSTNEKYLSHITKVSDLQAELHLATDIAKKQKRANTNKSVDELKKKVKSLKALLSAVQDYDEYKRAKKKYVKDTASLQERLDSLTKELGNGSSDEHSLKDIKRSLEKLNAKRSSEESRVERLLSLRDKYSALEESLPEKLPNRTVEQLGTRIGELEQIIELHRAVGKVSKECPLCGAAIEKSVFSRIAGDAESELPKRKKELTAAKGYAKLKEIQKEAKEYRGCEDALADLEAKIKVLESKKSLVERSTRLQTSIEDVTASLKQIRKPKSVDDPGTDKDEDSIESEIRSTNETISVLRDLTELLEEQSRKGWNNSSDFLQEEITKVTREQKKLVATINEINEVLPGLLSHQKQVIEHTKTKEDLEQRIEAIQTQLFDLPVLEALIKAYGSKGLKVDVMKRIGALVEANLNKYASLIFAEPFTFNIEIAENSFPVIVNRPDGKSSDINKLSGYEGSAFTLLLLLSMLPLIPRRLRADTIVLDECDALMGPPIKKMFFTKFLPVLNNVVPKICVITTDTKVQVEGARNILVEKEGAVSTLKEVYEMEGIL
jgi:DNA repair exonuclease SbcCD ATPase subunit